MKHLFLTLVLGFFAISCHRSTDEPVSPAAQLPAATQSGANTAGCLVNGQVLLPRGQKIQNGPVLTAQYQFLNGAYHFSVGITDNQNNVQDVGIASHNISFEINKTYNFSKNLFDDSKTYLSAYYANFNNNSQYNTMDLNPGELHITNLDTTKFIISGTFWFDAVNSKGEKVEVREGRFDVHYAP